MNEQTEGKPRSGVQFHFILGATGKSICCKCL